MNKEKDTVVIPENFHFEKPTLTEFTYNKVASVQGSSVPVTPGIDEVVNGSDNDKW